MERFKKGSESVKEYLEKIKNESDIAHKFTLKLASSEEFTNGSNFKLELFVGKKASEKVSQIDSKLKNSPLVFFLKIRVKDTEGRENTEQVKNVI
jgi:hypothetical protein